MSEDVEKVIYIGRFGKQHPLRNFYVQINAVNLSQAKEMAMQCFGPAIVEVRFNDCRIWEEWDTQPSIKFVLEHYPEALICNICG
jgi:hypothetical protein